MKLIALCSLLAATATVCADSKPKYVDASIGYFADSGELMYSGRFGIEFSRDAGRTHNSEVELGFTAIDLPGASIDVFPVLVNYKYVFPLQGKLDLFAGAGAGFSLLRFSVSTQSDSDFPFTYQLIAGVEYNVTEKSAFTLGTRYYDIGNAMVFDVPFEIGNDIEIRAGFRHRF